MAVDQDQDTGAVDLDMIMEDDTMGAVRLSTALTLLGMGMDSLGTKALNKDIEVAATHTEAEEVEDKATQKDRATIKVVVNMIRDTSKDTKVVKVGKVTGTCTIISPTARVKAKDKGMDTTRCPLKVLLKVITPRKPPSFSGPLHLLDPPHP